MVKSKDDVSVFFNVPQELLEKFNDAVKVKSKNMGVELNKKQAYNLALKEITELWNKEKPESK